MTRQKLPDKLIFIRHSAVQIDPERPSHEWLLSADGRARCRQLVPALGICRPTRIIASQEGKAVETGCIMAQELGLPWQTAPNLHEHDRVGAPYFDSQEAFHAIIAQLFRRPDKLVFGNETANQALHRFETAVRQLLHQFPEDTLAVVTHGTVLTLFLARYNQISAFPLWQKLTLPCLFVVSLPQMKITAEHLI